jgi:hypothetical protein
MSIPIGSHNSKSDQLLSPALTAQGMSVRLPTGSDAYSAIDTGTTLVGGPSEYMADLYSLIPGASAGSGNFEGYYTYRKALSLSRSLIESHILCSRRPLACDTTINVTVAFGGQNWPISAADFKLTQLTQNLCLGAFFDLATGRSAPSWIVGDTFLVRSSIWTLLLSLMCSVPLTEECLFGISLRASVYRIRATFCCCVST